MDSRASRDAGSRNSGVTRGSGPATLRPVWVGVLLWLAGCAGDGSHSEVDPPNGGTSAEIGGVVEPPATWTLADAPSVSIGIVEGDEAYQLDRVLSVVRMADGRLAALNAGSSEIRFFSSEGEHLTSVGGSGSGPGEFEAPRRLWRTPADSLVVFDVRTSRFSVLDGEGDLMGTRTFERPSAVAFPMDDWIHGHNWIESAVHPEDRGPILDALARMPRPNPSGTVRFVLLTDAGHLWTTTAIPPANSDEVWTVFDLSGEPVAAVTIPARFEVHEVGTDYVLGVARDEVGVESIQLYELTGPEGAVDGRRSDLGTSVALGGRATESEMERSGASPVQSAPPEVLGTLRMLSGAQEAEYGRSLAYTTDPAVLEVSIPDGLELSFIQGGPGGWSVIADLEHSDVQCYLGVGQSHRRSTPLGYTSGVSVCW